MCKRYSEGICHDGAAILKDGEMITIDKVLKLLNNDNWISIDDKLPESIGFYLVYFKTSPLSNEIGFCFYNSDKKWAIDNTFINPTYWMSLPQPPEEAE